MTDTENPSAVARDRIEAAKNVENEIVEDAKKAGVAVAQPNPDASPEDKKEATKRLLPPGLDLSKAKKPTATAVVSDLDVPPTTADSAMFMDAASTDGSNGVQKNGDLMKANGKAEPDWNRIGGWEPRIGGIDSTLSAEEEEAEARVRDHQTWVESQLDDKYFGEWYHNAGVIVFACFATWFVTKIGLGFGWMLIVLATCGTYYRTSIRRVHRNVKDDLTREMAKAKLETDKETLEWLNSFLLKMWPIYAPVLCKTVTDIANGVLAGVTPGFLDSVKLSTFVLGTKPPRIDHVKTYPKTEDDIVEFDWAFSFTPNDTSDMTSRQLQNKKDPKVVLEVRVGKGIVGAGIPIVVENMSCSGIMKVKLRLQIPFPHIEKVDVCFTEKPVFDYVLKPVGGESFGVDIGFLPGLSSFIQEQVHANLGPMFYAPNVFTLEIAKMLAGAPIDTSIGVLAVTIHNAKGLKNSDNFGGSTDPYTTLSLNGREVLAKTKTIHENANPVWNETKYIIIQNLNDSLTLDVFDHNDIRKHKKLGEASFPLEKLKEDDEHENVSLSVMSNNKARGQINFDVRYFPVLEPAILEDGTKEPVPETNTGIVRFTISQAKNLDASKSMVGQLSPYAQMLFNSSKVFTTKTVKRNNDPIWGESHEFLVTNRKACKLGVIVRDSRDFADDPVLGKYQLKLDELLGSKDQGWYNLHGVKSGRVKMEAQWKPVAIKGVAGNGGYVTPIGVMRIHFQGANDLRNLEAVGKSDPYAHVLLNGVRKARTVTFDNDLSPQWDEVVYIPVHSEKERLTLEVMDTEKMGKDRSMGYVELELAEFVKKDSEGLYQVHSEKANRSAGLVLGHKSTPKGTLNFTAAFYPCLNVADPEEEEEEKKLAELDTALAKGLGSPIPPKPNGAEAKSSTELSHPEADKSLAAQKSPLSPAFTVTSEQDEEEKAPPKIRLTPEELLTHETGLLIFKIIEGQFANTGFFLEVAIDDNIFPAYSTAKIKSRTPKFDEIGDCVVRELEFSQLKLRLREKSGEDDEDDIVASLSGNTLETLKQCLNNPTELVLRNRKDSQIHKVKVSLKYIPLLMKLDPSESINNMGTLRVEVLDAANLPAADRNGKSDPFCVFELDDKKIHETKVQKKTLHPAWNEVFETEIASRVASKLTVEVFDWDIGTKADFLAKTDIDTTALEPFTPQTFHYKLKGKKGEEGKFGEIRLRMVFKPKWITRTRQGSSTFHGTFAAPGKIVTGVAGAPLKVGGFAVGGVAKGASFLGKKAFGRKSTSKEGVDSFQEEAADSAVERPQTGGSSGASLKPTMTIDGPTDDGAVTPNNGTPTKRSSGLSPASGSSPHARSRSTSSQLSVPGVIGGPDAGTATVKLMSASGFPASMNVQIRVRPVGRSKDVFKSKSVKSPTGDYAWEETFTIECTADQQFKIFAKDNHLINDKELGEGLFVVDDTGSGQDTVINVGDGKVVLRTSFKAAETGSISPKRRGLLRRS